MKKLLATLIAGFLVSSAFAQSPAAPSAKTTGEATTPMGEATKAEASKTTGKHVKKHARKHTAKAAAAAK